MEKEFDYEKNLKELNDIANKLTNENLPIAESVKLYEEAEKLYKECAEYLENQNGQIYKIKQDLERYNEEKFENWQRG